MSQPLPFREQAKHLEQVQELDLKIDQLKKNRDSLPAALKTLDQSIAKARGAVEAKRKNMDDIEKVSRQTKAALELNQDRVTRSSGRMDGVHNSQEFNAVNKEIEQLKKQAASLEEQSKKSTADLENANKALETLNADLAKLEGERAEKSAQVSGQTTEFETEIKRLLEERKKFTTNIEPRILAQYDRVRVARAGIGFVPAVSGRCKGCNMVVPPQMYNEIQRGNAVHSCPSCHRLLYVPGSPGSQSASQAGANL